MSIEKKCFKVFPESFYLLEIHTFHRNERCDEVSSREWKRIRGTWRSLDVVERTAQWKRIRGT